MDRRAHLYPYMIGLGSAMAFEGLYGEGPTMVGASRVAGLTTGWILGEIFKLANSTHQHGNAQSHRLEDSVEGIVEPDLGNHGPAAA